MARNPRYDILITDDGVTRGYMLARDERGGRRWEVESTGASIVQQTPTETRYGNQPPIIETPLVFRSGHRGYGDESMLNEHRYHYGLNVDARFEGVILPGPLVTEIELDVEDKAVYDESKYDDGALYGKTAESWTIRCFFEQDGMIFALGGTKAFAISANDEVTDAYSFDAPVVDAKVWRGVAYIGLGYDDDAVYRESDPDPAEGWDEATGIPLGYMAPFRDRMWASHGMRRIRNVSSNPLSLANWSAPYDIGDETHEITSLAELSELLYIGKGNGLYTLDYRGYGMAATPELSTAISSLNCRNMRAWGGSMWVPHVRGLLQYRSMGANGFAVVPATPGAWVGSENPVKGRVTALAGDNRWLYAAILSPTGNTYIMAGRIAWEGERPPITWHPLVDLGRNECHAMHLSSLHSSPRLYFGMGSDAGYIVLPRNGENPLQDSACRYSKSGSIYYPAHDGFAPATTKLWKSIEVLGEGLTLGRYADVYYRMDRGRWVYAGKATRSPRDIIPLEPAGIPGISIETRVDLQLSESSRPLELRGVVLRTAERPRTVKVIRALVPCADNLSRRDGTRERRSGAQIMQEWEEYAQLGRAVQLTDTLGITRWVLVLAPIREVEVLGLGNEPPERLAQVSMAVFETEHRPGAEANVAVFDESEYDQGDVYGS